MTRISISLSEAMSAYVAERVNSGKYSNTSEYFRDLIRRDQERKAAEVDLRRMLDDAEESGPSTREPEDIWADAEARHAAEHGPVSADQTRGE